MRLALAVAAEEKITMELTTHDSPVPLRKDVDGAIRVGDTRVSLDVVVREYLKGNSPEAIVHGYPTLRLADVYAVVAYYLRNQGEVNAYLMACAAEAEQLRREIEARQPSGAELKAKLLARQAQMELQHASPGE